MMKVYRSKVGLEILIPIILIFGLVFFLIASNGTYLMAILILLPLALFITHMFLTTYYTIENSTLKIKCGFLYNLRVDVKSIRKITETNNALSSPAASLDRLEIHYGKYGSVLISPKDKHGFVIDMKSINPSIEVKLKLD